MSGPSFWLMVTGFLVLGFRFGMAWQKTACDCEVKK